MTKTKRKKRNHLPPTPPIPSPLREEGGRSWVSACIELLAAIAVITDVGIKPNNRPRAANS